MPQRQNGGVHIMADNLCTEHCGGFKEAVCIDAGRIYDSCCDKDCVEDLQLYFSESAQQIIDEATSVKCKCARVVNVYLDVEAVPFNRGFYSVDITFFFLVDVVATTGPLLPGVPLQGLATFSKKVILYGSEGSVKVFTSTEPRELPGPPKSNCPTATVQVVDPIVLSGKLVECRGHHHAVPNFPPSVCDCLEGCLCQCHPHKAVLVTLGLFTIVQIERKVQMMIPVYDFCVPDKESVCTTGDPCEMFKKIKFPTTDFFPPRLSDDSCCD